MFLFIYFENHIIYLVLNC